METTHYKLRIEFTEPVFGTQPQKDVATEQTQKKAREQGIPVEDELETLPEMLEKGTTVFFRRNGVPVCYDYQFKGFLKASAQVQNGIDGVKALRSKVNNTVFVFPRRFTLSVPSDITREFMEDICPGRLVIPSESEQGAGIQWLCERSIRILDQRGERTALARSEIIPPGTWAEFELSVVRSIITEKILRELLNYGQYCGIGQWRNASNGRFTYTLEKK